MATRYHLIISPRASADIHAIHKYIAQDSEQNAASMIQKLIDSLDGLEEFPHRYRVAEQVKSQRGETRVMLVLPYLVYYRIMDKQWAVQVITIRHGARRQPKRLD